MCVCVVVYPKVQLEVNEHTIYVIFIERIT